MSRSQEPPGFSAFSFTNMNLVGFAVTLPTTRNQFLSVVVGIKNKGVESVTRCGLELFFYPNPMWKFCCLHKSKGAACQTDLFKATVEK